MAALASDYSQNTPPELLDAALIDYFRCLPGELDDQDAEEMDRYLYIRKYSVPKGK